MVTLLPEKVETMEEKSEGNRGVIVLTEIHHCTGYKPAITQGTPSSRGNAIHQLLDIHPSFVPELQNKHWSWEIKQLQPGKESTPEE